MSQTDPQPRQTRSDWDRRAARALRVEMARRDVKCGDLAKLLAARGCKASAQSLRSKMSRGTFSASFFLQALDAMGCQQVELGSLGAGTEKATQGGPRTAAELSG